MKSVQARFTISFFGNLSRSAVSFLTSILLARAMGATEYGNLQFLTATALAMRQFLDVGSSNAFFTLVSQKQRGGRVIGVYFLWLAVQLASILLFLAALAGSGVWDRVWLGQSHAAVVLAVVSAVVVDGVWGTVVNIGESIRKTHVMQVVSVALAAVYLASVGVLLFFGLLSVKKILLATALLYGGLSAAALWWLSRFEGLELGGGDREWSAARVLDYFAAYCRPLLLLSVVSFLYNFADDWLLQNFSGARQQGIFGVSQQIANIVLLATTSFLKVFWKEISEAVESGNHARARDLYQTASRVLYFAAAAISAWMIPLSREIVLLTLGSQYRDAALPLAVMLLFPIHQTVGQLNGTYFFASQKVKTYARMGMIQMIAFLPVTYFLLAGREAAIPGLELGAVGIPLKMVCHQLISVNINAWMISRMQQCEYQWKFQFIALGCLLGLSFASTELARAAVSLTPFRGEIVLLAASAPLYAAALLATLELCPMAVGLKADEYARARERIIAFWRLRFAVAG